ncbi:MAG TPA: hypothetical protein VD905_05435 [Flavobacteriales bacterium]|nr:hypothetical protein [Flavobacteriales bacterium]
MGKFYANKRLNSGSVTVPLQHEKSEPAQTFPDQPSATSQTGHDAIEQVQCYVLSDTPQLVGKADTIDPKKLSYPSDSNGLAYAIRKANPYKPKKKKSSSHDFFYLYFMLTVLLILAAIGLVVFLIALIYIDALLAWWLALKAMLVAVGLMLLFFLTFVIVIASAIR